MNNVEYIAQHQHDANADSLWEYFSSVMSWVKTKFNRYRKEMAGVPWGLLYNRYKHDTRTPEEIESEVSRLMQDEDVTNKKGIYSYIFTGEEKELSIRTFTDAQKREAYERQGGTCACCGNEFPLEGLQAHHVKPWHSGGKTIPSNLKLLCPTCHRDV